MKKYISLLLLCFSIQLSACAQKPSATTQTNKKMEYNKLTPEEEYIILNKGTERPYTGKLLANKEVGTYVCRRCDAPLYRSEDKFDSHCGWPSFDKELKAGVIKETVDNTLGMRRVEITCAKCGGHLGHVFDDGPTDTGLRYCVNSVSIGFEAAKK
jgi:methionine-R-sulfoxide reductase